MPIVSAHYIDLIEDPLTTWSQWVAPSAGCYRLACCDCGLVHDVQFVVLLKGGVHLDRRRGQIKFRVRCNLRATAATRRKKKKTQPKKKKTKSK